MKEKLREHIALVVIVLIVIYLVACLVYYLLGSRLLG